MIGKIDFRAIVSDHYRTLTNENARGEGKQSGLDFILFYLVPVIVAAAAIGFHLILGKNMGNMLITALAVFAGLLFNLLILIFDITNKPRPDGTTLTKDKIRFLNEIYSNIAYAILISLLTIVIVLIHYLFLTLNLNFGFYISAFVVYFLCGNFVLTLFLVLKRVHKLLDTEFQDLKKL